MATALILTFTATRADSTGHIKPVGVSSQCLTFVDVGPAERALQALQYAHDRIGDIIVTGVIVKDVVI